MFKYFESLSPGEVDELKNLAENLLFKKAEGRRFRKGKNYPKVKSFYLTTDWFDWRQSERDKFTSMFPKSTKSRMVQCWFLKIPPHKGFLDEINFWVDKNNPGRIIATALQDQSIWLDGKEHRLNAGDQIGFSLSAVHEIKQSPTGGLWACAMILGCYKEHTD